MSDIEPRASFNDKFEYPDLERIVQQKQQHEDLYSRIDAELEENAQGLGLIRQALERQSPAVEGYIDILTLYVQDEMPRDKVSRTIYQSYHFARTVGAIVLPKAPGINTDGFFDDPEFEESEEAGNNIIVSAVNEYLQPRKSLDELMSYYSIQLDPSGEYSHVVELATGLTFKFMDNALKHEAITAEVEAFKNSIPAWIPEAY